MRCTPAPRRDTTQKTRFGSSGKPSSAPAGYENNALHACRARGIGRDRSPADADHLWSVGVAAAEHDQDRLQEDLYIEPWRPVTQVLQVVTDALAHLLDAVGLAAQAVHLRKAGHAGTYLVPDHVAGNELAILLVVRHRVRSGADNAHPSLQHVEKLWQLIERGLAQEASDAGCPRIFFGGLGDHCAVLADPHAAELVDHDLFAIQTVTALTEKYRSPGRELDCRSRQQHRQGGHEQHERRANIVGDALRHRIHPVEGCVAYR